MEGRGRGYLASIMGRISLSGRRNLETGMNFAERQRL